MGFMKEILIKGQTFEAKVMVEKFFHARPGGSKQRKSEIYKAERLGVEERCARSRKGRKLVAVGIISSGEIAIDEAVVISLPNGLKIKDTITRIEKDGEPIIHAITGEEVGICFANLRLRDVGCDDE